MAKVSPIEDDAATQPPEDPVSTKALKRTKSYIPVPKKFNIEGLWFITLDEDTASSKKKRCANIFQFLNVILVIFIFVYTGLSIGAASKNYQAEKVSPSTSFAQETRAKITVPAFLFCSGILSKAKLHSLQPKKCVYFQSADSDSGVDCTSNFTEHDHTEAFSAPHKLIYGDDWETDHRSCMALDLQGVDFSLASLSNRVELTWALAMDDIDLNGDWNYGDCTNFGLTFDSPACKKLAAPLSSIGFAVYNSGTDLENASDLTALSNLIPAGIMALVRVKQVEYNNKVTIVKKLDFQTQVSKIADYHCSLDDASDSVCGGEDASMGSGDPDVDNKYYLWRVGLIFDTMTVDVVTTENKYGIVEAVNEVGGATGFLGLSLIHI